MCVKLYLLERQTTIPVTQKPAPHPSPSSESLPTYKFWKSVFREICSQTTHGHHWMKQKLKFCTAFLFIVQVLPRLLPQPGEPRRLIKPIVSKVRCIFLFLPWNPHEESLPPSQRHPCLWLVVANINQRSTPGSETNCSFLLLIVSHIATCWF